MRPALVLTLLVFVAGCVGEPQEREQQRPEGIQTQAQETLKQPVSLTTEDGVRIAGTLYKNRTATKGVILLHQLGGDGSQWNAFVPDLAAYTVLTVDLRGHGSSQGDWTQFTEQDFSNMVLDVKAAKEFLASEGNTRVAVIGASIGANTAINFAAQHGADSVVALSPSFDYRGIRTQDSITRYTGPLLLVTASGDAQSYGDTQRLYELSVAQPKELKTYESTRHGVFLLAGTDLETRIIAWLARTL